MKIGILTFHSQLNYGGVLQCWALQQALTKLGLEVVVIDRWLDEKNWTLDRGFVGMARRQKIKYWIHLLLGVGDAKWHQRVLRTQEFVRGWLNLTPYHFHEWKDAPDDLGIDCLVVGSDQVWHCGDWNDPRPYLLVSDELNDQLEGLKIASYAASFGMKEIPKFLGSWQNELAAINSVQIYRRGLARFDAISCREKEGVYLCRDLGFEATHVVDPTMLLTLEDWLHIASCRMCRQLTCYFLKENVDELMPQLVEYARKMKCRVKVFVYDCPRQQDWITMPKSPRSIYRWMRRVWNRCCDGDVKVCEGDGPIEFVRAHAEAEWIVTDSFHSLMFAITFHKNVRVLRPKQEGKKNMFARIEEYALHADGRLISEDLSDALLSLSQGETVSVDKHWLQERRLESMSYLRSLFV